MESVSWATKNHKNNSSLGMERDGFKEEIRTH
jgi:hypothetical protein